MAHQLAIKLSNIATEKVGPRQRNRGHFKELADWFQVGNDAPEICVRLGCQFGIRYVACKELFFSDGARLSASLERMRQPSHIWIRLKHR